MKEKTVRAVPTYTCDTYIESLFQQKCAEMDTTGDLFAKWQQDKKVYTTTTNTIIFEFWHFSLHDKTHSKKILDSIELLLGKEQIDKLSISDLWLLLQCAYYHDVGMATTREELKKLWVEDKKFREYLIEKLSDKAELGESAQHIFVIDAMIRKYLELPPNEFIDYTLLEDFEYSDSWALDTRRYVTILMADFIRRNHAKRCLDALRKLNVITGDTVESRMYDVVAKASCAHGESFEYLFKELTKHERGFGTTHMHPRFIAALLRIGDLLDMDNNRFDMKVLAYTGKLPATSLLHFEKHKALTNYSIIEHRIKAKIVSTNYDVCREASNWFKFINSEIKDIIFYWNEICPDALLGCHIKESKLEIYYRDAITGKERKFTRENEASFSIDRDKLLNLLIGNNIYDSKFVFIREYIQNALDATKMQLWYDIKQKKHPYWLLTKRADSRNTMPFDLSTESFRTRTVEVRVSYDYANKQVNFEIKDHGIGMEKACIETISTIGKSWRGRPEYREALKEMPIWLRPTGGFGIGLQSAFMVTDKVTVKTKSELEPDGTEFTLQSPKMGGVIKEQKVYSGDRGTVVSLSVGMDNFLDLDELIQNFSNDTELVSKIITECEYTGKGLFSMELLKKVVEIVLKENIKKLQNTLIPITLNIDDKVQGEIYFGKTYYQNNSRENNFYELIRPEQVNGEVYISTREDSPYQIILWDLKGNENVCMLDFNSLGESITKKDNIHFYYKNIKVADKLWDNLQIEVWVDMYNRNVTELLNISRGSFINAREEILLIEIIKLVCQHIINELDTKTFEREIIEFSILFGLFTQNIIDDALNWIDNTLKKLENKDSQEKTIYFKLIANDFVKDKDKETAVGEDEIKDFVEGKTLELENVDEEQNTDKEEKLGEEEEKVHQENSENNNNNNNNSTIRFVEFLEKYKKFLADYDDDTKSKRTESVGNTKNKTKKNFEYTIVCTDEIIMNSAMTTDTYIISQMMYEILDLLKEKHYTYIPELKIQKDGCGNITLTRTPNPAVTKERKIEAPIQDIDGSIQDKELINKYRRILIDKLPYQKPLATSVLKSPLDNLMLEWLSTEEGNELSLTEFKAKFEEDFRYQLLICWVSRYKKLPQYVVKTQYSNLLEDLYYVYTEKGMDAISINTFLKEKNDFEKDEVSLNENKSNPLV